MAFLALAQRRAFSTTTDLIPRLESMLTNQSSTIPDLCCLSGEEYILLKFKLHILIYITMSVEVMGLINKDVLSNLMFCALNKDRKLRTSTSFWRKKSALCHHSNVCSQRFFLINSFYSERMHYFDQKQQNECCYFELSIHQNNLENIFLLPQKIKQHKHFQH